MGSVGFPVRHLETLSLQALQAKDEKEVAKLVNAASTTGAFYVNLLDSTLGQDVLALLPAVYGACKEYFAQPRSVKDEDFRKEQSPDKDRGYKWSEFDETFEMASDELLHQSPPLPSILQPSEEQLQNFAKSSQQVGTQVLQALSNGMGLVGNQDLGQHVNASGTTSDTALKFVSEPSIARASEVVDNTHTDGGLLSMVWCNEWGLVVKDDRNDIGSFTEPIDGTVIIHVADTLQRLTGGRLNSTVHQVTQPVDGIAPRYYIAYNLRPYHQV